jgi:hypothetical protein
MNEVVLLLVPGYRPSEIMISEICVVFKITLF